MKKIVTAAALALSGLALAAPAHADDDFEGPVSAADNWNFSAGVVGIQEAAVVPTLAGTPGYVGDHADNLSNGNVVDHS